MSVDFNSDRDLSRVSIRSTLSQAREIAVAVLEGLNHRVRQNRILIGALLNWRYGIDFAPVILICGALASIAIGLLVTALTKLVTWVVLIGVLAFRSLYVLAKRGYPYT